MRSGSGINSFSPVELRELRALKTPAGVQRFLDSLPYHLADTSWSPRKVLQKKTAHCLEGAIFGAAALRVLGFPPLLWDLEAVNDTDHVLAIFKVRGCWGAVAKSNFSGCRYREPVYRTLRELAMSYFNIYFNLRGERTLRCYSQPVDLSRFDDRHWMTSNRRRHHLAVRLDPRGRDRVGDVDAPGLCSQKYGRTKSFADRNCNQWRGAFN